MSRKDIFKIILVTLIVLACMATILVIFSKKYLEQNVTVAENQVEEKKDNNDGQDNGIVIDEIASESPTPTPSPILNIETEEPKNPETPQYDLKPGVYYIKVNNEMNTVTVYIKDDNGQYTIPVKAMICSIGDTTPENCKIVLGGKRWKWRALFGNVYGQYTTHIDGNILFHSVPYLKDGDKSSLEYWEYDKLGTKASLGCIRLKVEDAKWIYENCLAYSTVEFYSDPNPGPLGKPTAMKISEYEEYRDWDPTDPDENNPWRNFEGEIY